MSTSNPANSGLGRYRLLAVNIILALTFAGSLWGRQIDSVKYPDNFLRKVQIPYHGWTTSDLPLSSGDLNMLQPDAYVVRNYRGPGNAYVQLAVIAGHRKQSIHTPAFCMAGGGWETITQQQTVLNVAGKRIPAALMVMQQDRTEIVTTYFFTDGAYSSASLLPFQAVQFLNRFRSTVPMGALVRIIVPVTTNLPAAEGLTADFAQAAVPSVLREIRQASIDPGKAG